MAWTAPMTAVDGNVFTAAQYNQQIRDNFLETAPAKASGSTGYFVNSGVNAISRRDADSNLVNPGDETTSSVTYTALSTAGPAVTITTGTKAMVMFAARVHCNVANIAAFMSVAVSGATTIAANDSWALQFEDDATSTFDRTGVSHLFTTLNAGSNTFTCQYRSETAANLVTFNQRSLIVIPLS